MSQKQDFENQQFRSTIERLGQVRMPRERIIERRWYKRDPSSIPSLTYEKGRKPAVTVL